MEQTFKTTKIVEMKIQGNSILVKPDENPDKTKGGIINPVVKDKPKTGVAIQCGLACTVVEEGDRIQYKRKGASIIHLDGIEHHFIIEDQIFFNYGQ